MKIDFNATPCVHAVMESALFNVAIYTPDGNGDYRLLTRDGTPYPTKRVGESDKPKVRFKADELGDAVTRFYSLRSGNLGFSGSLEIWVANDDELWAMEDKLIRSAEKARKDAEKKERKTQDEKTKA